MKAFPLRILLAMAMLSPALAPAELILYKGTRRDSYAGEGYALAVTWKTILIVDHDTAHAAILHYATIRGGKFYWTSKWTNTHFVVFKTGAAISYTAIARPRTECEISDGATGEGVYCKGANATLMVNTNSTASFPRVMSTRGNGLSYSEATGQPIFDEGSIQLVFDHANTMASNKNGDTLDAAFTRFIAYVKSLGYSP